MRTIKLNHSQQGPSRMRITTKVGRGNWGLRILQLPVAAQESQHGVARHMWYEHMITRTQRCIRYAQRSWSLTTKTPASWESPVVGLMEGRRHVSEALVHPAIPAAGTASHRLASTSTSRPEGNVCPFYAKYARVTM